MCSQIVIPVEFLGQAGFRLDFDGIIVFIDPYLSDRVERIEGPELRRQRPAPYMPDSIKDADYVLITHIHMDHCDPDTLLPLLGASPRARVVGPHEVTQYLLGLGVSESRLIPVSCREWEASPELVIIPVPAAHPEIEYDESGNLRCVGYLISYKGKSIYHSGDTSPADAIMSSLIKAAPIDVALLPINEKNFYRDKQGIIGNMSIREAFGMALDMKARVVVPMHYDMFKPNMTYLEELQVVYRELKPDFTLSIEPDQFYL